MVSGNLQEMDVLADSFRVMYWGILLSTAFFGITILQAWTYMNTNTDRWPLRTLVAVLVALDLATSILIGHLGYYSFVDSFGDFVKVYILEIAAPLEALVSLIVTFLIQCFFASRVFILYPGGKLGPSLILIFALPSAVAGILLAVHVVIYPSVFSFATTIMRVYVGLYIGFSVISDSITTYYLSRTFSGMRGMSDTSRADLVIRRLLNFVVTRGIVVWFAQTVTLVAYFAQPDGLYWTPFHFCTSRIYVITMIAMLNGREEIKHDLKPQDCSKSASDAPPISRLRFQEYASTFDTESITQHITSVTTISTIREEDLERLAWKEVV